MPQDVRDLTAFYDAPLGQLARRAILREIQSFWPDLRNYRVLGYGFTIPYLRAFTGTERSIAAMPALLGVIGWPDENNAALLCEEDALPFPDVFFDRILIVHGLEVAENARRMLREAWRVLKDDGRLLIVTPNRTGMWAYWESTPFGHGQPYTAGQLGRLLSGALFRVERRDTALWMPPWQARLILRSAPLFERAGRQLAPGLAGVTITEAVKDVYAAVPLQPAVRRRLVQVEAA